jgi:predicted ATPase
VTLVLWSLGYPDQALKRSHEALTLAQKLSHPFTLAFASNWAAWVHQCRREGQAVQEWAEAAVELSREQGFAFWLTYGTILRGWALAEQGYGEEGITQMRQGLAAYRATRVEAGQPEFLGLLVETYEKAGQTEEGLSALAEALAIVDKTGERFYEAELYRLKGELTLQHSSVQGLASRVQRKQKAKIANPQSPSPNPQAEAEACFHKAIEIARQQQAKSLELRASTSLARLWRQQGKQKQAHKVLVDIYGWFTEGFDTKDLQEAKALLKELS